MRVLMISEKDAANASLGRIAEEFIVAGDEVEVFATHYEEQVLSFFSKDIPKLKLADIKQDDIEWCDIIFCSTLVSIYIPFIVFAAKKPIFTHNYLMNRQINWGGDICFAPTQQVVASDYDQHLSYSYVGIGEPKYDDKDEKQINEEKRFLFIDSGHYPFSDFGKRELARTLLDICDSYPEYELVIKPRFLPDDKIITHQNSVHIYDVINDICENNPPENLIMLDYHADLKTLIDTSHTVICMYTTAFVGAAVSGKGLIVLENLPSTDVYDIRHKTYMRNRENMTGSGALVDYHEVHALLPDGARGDQSFLDYLLEEKEFSAKKIVEVCAYLFDRYYSANRFPVLKDTTYKQFKNDLKEDMDMTWDLMISRRCRDYMVLKSMILIDFHVKAKLDISCILDRVKESQDVSGQINAIKFKEFLGNAGVFRDECIIKNRSLMLKDDIDSGILLNAYYLQCKYDEIRSFPQKETGAFHMYRAFAALDDEEKDGAEIAKNHLIRYFDICGQRHFNLEISDMSDNRFKAYESLIIILKMQEDTAGVSKYHSMLMEYYQRNYMDNDLVEPGEKNQLHRFLFIKDTEKWLMKRWEK